MGLRIGLTGGIGSGKSTVAGIFKVLGIPVFDADSEARKIMETDPALRQSIINTFGTETYKDGHLNRTYLSSIVFNNPDQLARLNSLVHPATIAAAEDWAIRQTASYIIKEAAIFFESGSAAGLSYMIGVSAPEDIRIKRVMERDNVPAEEVVKRMQRQIQEDLKMRLCDYVIMNDDRQLLILQVLTLHEQFLKESKQNHVG